MARQLKIHPPQKKLVQSWKPEIVLENALKERSRFLEKYPRYKKFQNEIDRLVEKAGNSENKMTVLALMIESKLADLHQQLNKLNGILLTSFS
ncbi:MAG: hypothetical protein GY874_22325 [Desulfobacteraceae bacterium]|nr:hypothetical protein [Desulfobacteraceae bacterium]